MRPAERPLGTDLSDPDTRPGCLWDEDLPVRELQAILADERHPRWIELAGKVMRQARDDRVWPFLPVARVAARYADLAPRLGRRRPFRDHLLAAWRRQGRCR